MFEMDVTRLGTRARKISRTVHGIARHEEKEIIRN
jgi:hypothetical protein